MNELLKNALERREQLYKELETVENFIKSYSEVVKRTSVLEDHYKSLHAAKTVAQSTSFFRAVQQLETVSKLNAIAAPTQVTAELREKLNAALSAQSFVNSLFDRSERARENEAMMDTAETLIIAAGRPLSRSVLLKELEKSGHLIVGSDRSKVLGTNLWRSKRFLNLKGAGYWPKSVPIPDDYKEFDKRASALEDGDKD